MTTAAAVSAHHRVVAVGILLFQSSQSKLMRPSSRTERRLSFKDASVVFHEVPPSLRYPARVSSPLPALRLDNRRINMWVYYYRSRFQSFTEHFCCRDPMIEDVSEEVRGRIVRTRQRPAVVCSGAQ